MKTLDPSIRQAAQRVTAWHVARWRAQLEALDSTLPQPGPEAPQDTGNGRQGPVNGQDSARSSAAKPGVTAQ
ncbi:MAG: hypothetical protein AB1430_06050 [Pseudomonadota bacterium]